MGAMQVDTMRAIDYWVGIPLTFLATLAVKAWEWLVPRRPRPPRNVLFIELSEMGSTILVDPVLRHLQREHGCSTFFLIFARNKASLDLLHPIPEENIRTIREDGLFHLAWDTLAFLVWARRRQIDTVVDLELFSRFTALLTGLSGARRRVGFHAFTNEGLYRGDLLTHKVAYNPHLHITKNFFALAHAVTAAQPETPFAKIAVPDSALNLPQAMVTPAEETAMRTRLREWAPAFDPARHRLVLFNANASDLLPLRRWPQEHYIALARLILERHPRVFILLTGAPSEREGLEAIPAALRGAPGGDRCANFAGATTLTELPALYRQAAFMLSNDSGPAHFAAVTPMPTYVFFGPETPRLYGSLGKTTPIYAGLACSPCVSAANHRKTPCNDNVCLRVITPEQVYEILRPALTALDRGREDLHRPFDDADLAEQQVDKEQGPQLDEE